MGKRRAKQSTNPEGCVSHENVTAAITGILLAAGITPGSAEARSLLRQLLEPSSPVDIEEGPSAALTPPKRVRRKRTTSPPGLSGIMFSERNQALGSMQALIVRANACDHPEQAISLLNQAIQQGGVALKDEISHASEKSLFSPELDLFMNARCNLALILLSRGDYAEAVSHLESVLEIDRLDTRGVRTVLLEWYCRLSRFEDAERILHRFSDDNSTAFEMTRICLMYQKSGPGDVLEARVHDAEAVNPFVVPLLIRGKDDALESSRQRKTKTRLEASEYCEKFRALWRATPGALPWLEEVAASRELHKQPVSDEQLKEMVAGQTRRARRLPMTREVWFCDIDVINPSGTEISTAGVKTTAGVGDEENNGQRLISLFISPDGEIISVSVSGIRMGFTGILSDILDGIIEPGTGVPRRPRTIRFSDKEVAEQLESSLKSLKISAEFTEDIPEIVQFLRSQRYKAAHKEFPIDQLLSTPVDFEDSWEFDWRRLDTWITHERTSQPVQPSMILVASPEGGFVRMQQLVSDDVTLDDLRAVLSNAILCPFRGEIGRPRRLIVRQLSHRLMIEPAAESIGIEVVVGECQMVDFIHDRIIEERPELVPSFSPLSALPDVNTQLMEEFYSASAAYYRSRVFTRVCPDTVVEMTCTDLLPGVFTAVTIGQQGQEIGMMLLDNPVNIRSMLRQRGTNPEKTAAKLRGIGYSLGARDTVHPADVEAADLFGWPVPSTDTWPSAYYLQRGKVRDVKAVELKYLTGAIRVAMEILSRDELSAEMDIPLAGRTFRFSARKINVT